ncbi:ATP-binding cassette sub-family G member 1 isoform X1 [Leptinotarsa decemlineata]|uniref:ATP-binding cassette sub-family G member 1 isoform X1 n=1 Tax=Leptinotarsa decemlineata TaxID=7539 RepID=UPI003D30AFDE
MDVNIKSANMIDVEFMDVTFSAKENGKFKQIIKGVSGRFLSGELTAIMGPSGAGKTCLLNILTGYQVTGMQGAIKFSSSINSTNDFAKRHKPKSCYILQDDTLPSFLTVEETMMMCCCLKMDNLTKKTRKFLIDDILSNLGLDKCRDSRCQSLSGGQRKRVSIALELVDNPPIMFLDEPTTGLDSSSAAQCVQVLKNLARGGRTVVCTIHQPNASLYEQFDNVFVMAAGRCVYHGPTSSTVDYLSTFGLNCPQYHNPADYLLEVVCGEHGDYFDILAAAAKDEKWRESLTTFRIHHMTDLQEVHSILPVGAGRPYETPSEWSRLLLLLKRNGRHVCRDHSVVHLKLFLNVLVGIGIGLVFQNCGNDSVKAVSNVGFLLTGLVYLTFTAIMPSVLRVPSELAGLKKEVFNNWYSLKTYYAALLLLDIPFQIVFSIVYSVPSYFISDQPRDHLRFCMVGLIHCLTSLVSSGFGLILGTLFNPINGTFIGSVAMALMLCLGGFLMMYPHMSAGAYYFTYLSFMSYATEGVVQALYGYNRDDLHCSETEEYCRHISPKLLLKEIGMEQDNYWFDVLYIFLVLILFRSLAFSTLRRKVSSR